DVVHGVFGKAAIGREAVRAMALVAEAVIEAGGVHALAAPRAAPAAGVDLDRDAIANLEFVDRRAQLDDGAHIFVPDGEALVEGKLAIDGSGQTMPHDLDVGGANRDRIDAHENF